MPSLLKEFLIIALLVAGGSTYSLVSGLAPLPGAEPPLSAGEIRLAEARALEPLWIDARSEEEFAEGAIEGAFRLSDDNWEEALPELIGRWLAGMPPLVVYCSSASCDASKRIAGRLREALPDAEIFSLQGGWPQ